MNKLKFIIAREYLTRVRKKSFIIMTILGPLLFACMMIAPVWLSQVEDKDVKTIAVIEIDNNGKPVPDSLMAFKGKLKDTPQLKFDYLGNIDPSQAETIVRHTEYFGMLIINHGIIVSGPEASVELLAKKQPSFGIENYLKDEIEKYLYEDKLNTYYNVSLERLKSLKTAIKIETRKIDKSEVKDQGNLDIKRGLGYISAFLIYMFILFFGAQVMRGVVEEKSNRILEVIITSVKPFQLMMGKIIGIGLVGLTQFLVWILLSGFIFQGAESIMMQKKLKEIQVAQSAPPTQLFLAPTNTGVATPSQPKIEDAKVSGIMKDFYEIDFLYVIVAFLFYFIGGFLLYGAMFAAIGAAVDGETDTQQFMLPVTIPLIVSIVVMMNTISNPEGQIAFWFSIIPFTSPIVMMARIGFDVPWQQLALSGGLLVATFIFMTWFAGKIYRTGILMYGKKTGYKEIWKWLRYK
jgi:ABC-2 type transport system permease protein